MDKACQEHQYLGKTGLVVPSQGRRSPRATTPWAYWPSCLTKVLWKLRPLAQTDLDVSNLEFASLREPIHDIKTKPLTKCVLCRLLCMCRVGLGKRIGSMGSFVNFWLFLAVLIILLTFNYILNLQAAKYTYRFQKCKYENKRSCVAQTHTLINNSYIVHCETPCNRSFHFVRGWGVF